VMDRLSVYMTDRCNLACGYCWVAVNRGAARGPSAAALRRAVDDLLDRRGSKIVFLGGEPLLRYPALLKTAEYARSRSARLVMEVLTNGTLLDSGRLEALFGLGVNVTVSLDGPPEVNDAGRGRSVAAKVLRRLEGWESRLGVNSVFCPATACRLEASVDFLRRRGFGRISLSPDMNAAWSDESLEGLRTSLAGLRRAYRRTLMGSARPFQIPTLFSVLEHRAPGRRRCRNLALGPDGSYYACDRAMGFPAGAARGLRVGKPGRFDRAAREAILARAEAAIGSLGWSAEPVFCPMGPFFHAGLGREAADPRLEGFRRLSETVSSALHGIVDDNRDLPAYKALYEDVRLV